MSEPLSTTPTPSPVYAAISRKTTIRAIIAAALIVAGIVSMNTLEASLHLTFNKPPMPLPKHTLTALGRQLAGRYVQEGTDEVMPEDQVEVLGTNDYLLRTYRDSTRAQGDPTQYLHLNLNYYSTGSAEPHVPEICWAGVGMKEATWLRKVFEIPNVRRADGTIVTLRAHMISFLVPGQGTTTEKLKNVAYVYNVNGDYVATPKEVTSKFWKASNKYAFDTKIEVTVGNPSDFCSQQDAQRAISDFMRNSIDEIEQVLPSPNVDPAKAGPSAGVPGTSQ